MAEMKFIPRSFWGGGAHRASTANFHPEDGGVTCHWEATRGLQAQLLPNHEHCYNVVWAVFDFHTRPESQGGRGWADIAYSALVCPHGHTFEGRWVGRRTAANGYTAVNDLWYAVCALNGVGDEPTAALLVGMRATVEYLWSKDARDRVNGHRDHKPTECPGDVIYRWAHSGMPISIPEDDMNAEQDARLRRIEDWLAVPASEGSGAPIGPRVGAIDTRTAVLLKDGTAGVPAVLDRLASLEAKVDKIAAGNIDYAILAKAVNDDAAARMQS